MLLVLFSRAGVPYFVDIKIFYQTRLLSQLILYIDFTLPIVSMWCPLLIIITDFPLPLFPEKMRKQPHPSFHTLLTLSPRIWSMFSENCRSVVALNINDPLHSLDEFEFTVIISPLIQQRNMMIIKEMGE